MAALPETLGTSLVQSRMVVNLSQQLLSEEPSLAAQGATNLTRLLLSEGGIEVLFREPAGIVVRPAAHPLVQPPVSSRGWTLGCGRLPRPSCVQLVLVYAPSSILYSALGLYPRAFVSPPLALRGSAKLSRITVSTVSPRAAPRDRTVLPLIAGLALSHPPVTWFVIKRQPGTGGAQAVSQLGVLMQIAATKGPQVREFIVLKNCSLFHV